MGFRQSAKFCFVFLVLSSCKTTTSEKYSKLKNSELIFFKDMKKIQCEKGDLAYFTLNKVEGPEESDFEPLPMVDKWGGFDEYIQSGGAKEFRIELCAIDDELIPLRIVYKRDTSYYFAIDIPKDTKAIGLKEAIYEGDYTKLDFQVPILTQISHGNIEATPDVLVVKGSKANKAAIIYTMFPKSNGMMVGSKIGSSIIEIGTFEYQEPASTDLVNLPADCNLKPSDPLRPYRADPRYPHALKKGVIEKNNFKIEWVTFTPTGKITAGAGIDANTSFWSLSYMCKVTITDKAQELGNNAGIPISFIVPFEGPEEAAAQVQVLKYYATHHGTFDALWIRSPFAVYGFGAPKADDPYIPDPGNDVKVTYEKLGSGA